MLENCCECNFNICADDEYCHDCGVASPAESFKYSDDGNNFFVMFLVFGISTLILTPVILLISSIDSEEILRDHIYYSLIIAAVLSLIPGYFLASIITIRKFRKEKRRRHFIERPSSLGYKEHKIFDVIIELAERETRLNGHLPENFMILLDEYAESGEDRQYFFIPDSGEDKQYFISEYEHQKLNDKQQKLYNARLIVQQQIELCHLMENKIEIARLENDILPYVVASQNLTESELQEAASEINSVLETFDEMRNSVRQNAEADLLDFLRFERENLLRHIERSERFCRKKFEELTLRQSSLSFQNSSDFISNTNFSGLSKFRTLEIYTTKPLLPPRFDELEKEYHRLIDETDVLENY